MDARWFTELGYRVIGYDNSPGMLARLLEHSGPELARHTIAAWSTPYQDFLAGPEIEADAVISNFSVLNLVETLDPLFARFAAILARGGVIIATVLNPYFWEDARRRWWWRIFAGSRGKPYLLQTAETRIYRHRRAAILRAARPYFRLVKQASVRSLVRRYRGHHVWGRPTNWREWLET